ncbi:MAG: hypothetical protein NTU73_06420, partial [Ignavibacteriae bacterium]|nr:hypothetical protein [Ignavibacteriota bacterium]
INFLKNSLGVKDTGYQFIADRLAMAIFECGIDFFSATGNDDIFQPEYEYALSIAVSKNTKQTIKKSLESCMERWNLKITVNEIEKEKEGQKQVEKKYTENARQYDEKKLPKCWFCSLNLSDDSCKFTASVYKESIYKRVGNRSNTNYKTQINIPRCKSCKAEHKKTSHKIVYSLICFGLISILTGLTINENTFKDDWFIENWYFCLIIGLIIGFTVGILLIRKDYMNNSIINTQNFSIKNYPELKEKIKQGWQFSSISTLISDLLNIR